MLVESTELETALRIAPSDTLYEIVLAFKHPTLNAGDVVKMVSIGHHNLFVRRSDLTAHALYDDNEYVVVRKL